MILNKNIVVFSDGTGQDGLITTFEGDLDPSTNDDRSFSNVLRLCRAVKRTSSLATGQAYERPQIVFYQSGIGTDADFQGKTFQGMELEQLHGVTAASKIRDAYNFICQNYNRGDQICLFGFSRGAYIARKVAGLIEAIGLLEPYQMGNFFKIWNQLADPNQPNPPVPPQPIPIKCVGVWDTVASVLPGSIFTAMPLLDALKVSDGEIPSNVEISLQALALQENRKPFLPTLWKKPKRPGQVLKQVWFPGAHTNVGGGYLNQELADIALFWMAGEILTFLDIDKEFVFNSRYISPKSEWGAAQPVNTQAVKGIPLGGQHRLHLLTPDEYLHPCLQAAPKLITPVFPLVAMIDPTSRMITMSDVYDKFKKNDWKPNWWTPNAFEAECKARWHEPPTVNANKTPKFERPNDFKELVVSVGSAGKQ